MISFTRGHGKDECVNTLGFTVSTFNVCVLDQIYPVSIGSCTFFYSSYPVSPQLEKYSFDSCQNQQN